MRSTFHQTATLQEFENEKFCKCCLQVSSNSKYLQNFLEWAALWCCALFTVLRYSLHHKHNKAIHSRQLALDVTCYLPVMHVRCSGWAQRIVSIETNWRSRSLTGVVTFGVRSMYCRCAEPAGMAGVLTAGSRRERPTSGMAIAQFKSAAP